MAMDMLNLVASLSARGEASHPYKPSGRMRVCTTDCLASMLQGIADSFVARLWAFLILAVRVEPVSLVWVERCPPRSLVSLRTLMVVSRECQWCSLSLNLVSAEVLKVKHFLGAGLAPRSIK